MIDDADNWGQIGHLTEDQLLALAAIQEDESARIRLLQAKYTVESLEQVACRFLRARNFDVDKAKLLLAEREECIKEHEALKYAALGPEESISCDEKVLKTFYPHSQMGRDRKGRLLMFEHNGGSDINAVLHVTTTEGMVRYHFWTMEKVIDELYSSFPPNPDTGVSVISTCAICDFEGLGMQHCTSLFLDHLKRLIKIDNICYPEMLGKLIVINAPGLVTSLWGLVKGWLDPRTQKKIEIHGSGPQTIERLHELVDPQYLPQKYGGTGPDVYFAKPNTEYVAVRGDGEIAKEIFVPAGHELIIDSYIQDSAFDIEIKVGVHSLEDNSSFGGVDSSSILSNLPASNTENLTCADTLDNIDQANDVLASDVGEIKGAIPSDAVEELSEALSVSSVSVKASSEEVLNGDKKAYESTVETSISLTPQNPVIYLKETLEPSKGEPKRFIMKMPVSSRENKTFYITWKNKSYWFQKMLVYSLTTNFPVNKL
jgi:hypothetical protein